MNKTYYYVLTPMGIVYFGKFPDVAALLYRCLHPSEFGGAVQLARAVNGDAQVFATKTK